MGIQYIEGDLFNHLDSFSTEKYNLIPHVVNDIGAWGAGFVVPLGKRFPVAKNNYSTLFNHSTPLAKLGDVQFVKVENSPEIVVCNMFAQHKVGGVRPLRYNALAACMDKVGTYVADPETLAIHAPLFGAGLAGGNWEFIEKLIEDAWLQRGIDVTVYYLPGTLVRE